MKIAVTTEQGQVFQHFGQCRQFTVYTVIDGQIRSKAGVGAGENGHSALAGLLANVGISVLICGGIGGGARQMLAMAGIELVSGVEGSVEDAVRRYLSGELTDQGSSCSHHDHGHDAGCSCQDHCHS